MKRVKTIFLSCRDVVSVGKHVGRKNVGKEGGKIEMGNKLARGLGGGKIGRWVGR